MTSQIPSQFVPDSEALSSDRVSSSLPALRSVTAKELADLQAKKVREVVLPLEDDEVQQALDNVQEIADFRHLYSQYGYTAAIDLGYKKSKDGNHPFMGEELGTLNKWREIGIPLLASSPASVLEAFLGQGIAPSISGDASLEDLYNDESGILDEKSAWIQRGHANFAPCIYVRELVDKNNHSPTPNQLVGVIAALRAYASGEEDAAAQNAEIERKSRHVQSSEDDIVNGHHLFFSGSLQRVKTLLTFCTALEKSIADLEEDSPLPWTLKYVGYAKQATHRLSSYKEDRSQSWLSELVRNAAMFLFPNSVFELKTHAVVFCASFEEVQIGEEMLSRIGQAYFETGTGFGVAAAGVQVSSADLGNVLHREALRMWETTSKFRADTGVLEGNLHQENKKMAQYRLFISAEKEKRASERKKRKREMKEQIDENNREAKRCEREMKDTGDDSSDLELEEAAFAAEAEALEKSLEALAEE